MKSITAFADQAGALGTPVSAAACPACFAPLALLYAGLASMVTNSLRDLWSPPRSRQVCRPAGCEQR